MLTKDFYFDLPEELIAQHPSGVRGEDKLMVLSRNGGNQTEITEPKNFKMEDLPDLIPENTLMIFNNSKVRRSRCYGKTVDTGRECEFLMLTPYSDGTWKAMVKNAKKNKPGKVFVFNDGSKGTIVENSADIGTEFRTVKFDVPITEEWFERNGHIPLPPYIRREDTEEDCGLCYMELIRDGMYRCAYAGCSGINQ